MSKLTDIQNEFIRHYLHSKQGISFVTLRHKTVITMLSQSFVVSDSNCAI